MLDKEEITELVSGSACIYFIGGLLAVIGSRHVHVGLVWPYYLLRTLWDATFGGVSW